MPRWFDLDEFDCPCCGSNNMHSQALQMFDQAREIAGIPFVVTEGGGFRCQQYIENGKSVANTSHGAAGIGWAGDFRAETGNIRWKIMRAGIQVGFTRIGVHRHFVHLDCDPTKPPKVVWVY